MGNDVGSAFVAGWFQGALLTALALLLCGLVGREWHNQRDLPQPRVHFHWDAPASPAPAKAAPGRKAAPAPADPGVRQARAWARCSGPACYYDVRGAGGLP